MRKWFDRLFEIRSFILHEFSAHGPHGVHSPFVFDLINNFSRASIEPNVLNELRGLHKSMRRDSAVIEKLDFGTGKSGPVKICGIANRSIKPFRQSIFIAWIAQHLKCQSILELGSCLGTTTSALALLNQNSIVTSIEGCPNTARIASDNVRRLGIHNAKIIHSEINQYLRSLAIDELSQFDFIMIDCNHTYAATVEYFLQIESSRNDNIVVICDDIHWSADMNRAWKFMSQRSSFEISIDFLHFGLLARRLGKVKEHFVLKLPR